MSEKKIDLAEFGRKIYQYRDLPERLDSINIQLAGYYSFYSAKMIPLELSEASFWEKTKGLEKEKPLSDSMVRALWKVTKEGYEMIEVERTIKTIEKLMSTLRTSINRADREMRSLTR